MSGSRKYGFLQLELSPEEWLERETKAWAARGKVNGYGRYASRAMKDIAGGLRFPDRIPARIIAAALKGGATVEWAREFARILDGYTLRKAKALGKLAHQPEPPTPSAPAMRPMLVTGEFEKAA